MTLELLWMAYRETHPDGYGYSQFAKLYKVFKGHVDVVMRQVHRAGEKLFVDFPGMKIPIHDRRSEAVVFCAELFVAVSGASSYLFAEALPSQELMHWVAAHVHTFEAMGGCHEIVVYDNLRFGGHGTAQAKQHRRISRYINRDSPSGPDLSHQVIRDICADQPGAGDSARTRPRGEL